tara:strand:- start:475 stop:702 length:228 start_codon:yes stop_codon:yes gene_type:complete
MDRVKTVTHAEYEIIRHIMEVIDISDVKASLVPPNDEVAEKRFDTGAKNISHMISNLGKRRLHKLPKDHPDYKSI